MSDSTLARQPKTKRGQRALEKRKPQVVEEVKNAFLVKGTKTSQVVNDVLRDFAMMKKPDCALLRHKNEIKPFEDTQSIEFLSNKNNAGLFVVGTHSKKRFLLFKNFFFFLGSSLNEQNSKKGHTILYLVELTTFIFLTFLRLELQASPPSKTLAGLKIRHHLATNLVFCSLERNGKRKKKRKNFQIYCLIFSEDMLWTTSIWPDLNMSSLVLLTEIQFCLEFTKF